jgi:purine-binding chemotaxis protein CheW
MESTAQALETQQYLTFGIADEEYAVGILRVREIIQYETVTKVPTTPPWIRGVINLRGSVVPVIDLAVKFGLPEKEVQKTTCIVIVEVELSNERTVMGVVADNVSQVIDLKADDIEPPSPFGTRIKVDFLQGMGKIGKEFALILDIDRVLSTDGLLNAIAMSEAEAEAVKADADTKGETPRKRSSKRRERQIGEAPIAESGKNMKEMN